MKHELVKWLCIDLTLVWYELEPWWDQIKLSFCEFYIWHECEKLEKSLAEWATEAEKQAIMNQW